MKRLSIFSFLVIAIAITAFAQAPDTLWTRTYGGTGDDQFWNMDLTSDGGFICVGPTTSFGSGQNDIYLVKINAVGTQQWHRTFGGSDNDFACSVQQTADGGFIIIGTTYSYGSGRDDFYLIKTNASGAQQWYRVFGGSNYEWGNGVQQTGDLGYIIVGSTSSYGAGNEDVYVIKTDSTGSPQWERTLGGSDYDHGHKVQQTTDGGYIIVGSTASFGAGNYDVYLIKLDIIGNMQWYRTYGGSGNDYGYMTRQTNDGGFIIGGRTESFGSGDSDGYLIKTDATGTQQWQRTFGGVNYEQLARIQQTSDGGYITSGYTASYGSGNYDLYLIKTDASGNLQWDCTFGGSGNDYGGSSLQTSDWGYIMAGHTQSFGAGGSDGYLIRLAGSPLDLMVTLTPQITPVTIPSGGGGFLFDVEIANNTTSPQAFDIWTQVELPNVGVVPILNRSNLTIPASANFNRTLSQTVPAQAPAGNYLYYAYIGDYPWTVEHFDCFPFEKQGTEGEGYLGDSEDWACYGWFDDEEAVRIQDSGFGIQSCNPNPFNASTVARFELRDASQVKLAVYNIAGREVAVLADGWQTAGAHNVEWEASSMPSGVYFARLDAGGDSQTRKLILLK